MCAELLVGKTQQSEGYGHEVNNAETDIISYSGRKDWKGRVLHTLSSVAIVCRRMRMC